MDVKMALTLDRLDFLSERPSQPSGYRDDEAYAAFEEWEESCLCLHHMYL